MTHGLAASACVNGATTIRIFSSIAAAISTAIWIRFWLRFWIRFGADANASLQFIDHIQGDKHCKLVQNADGPYCTSVWQGVELPCRGERQPSWSNHFNGSQTGHIMKHARSIIRKMGQIHHPSLRKLMGGKRSQALELRKRLNQEFNALGVWESMDWLLHSAVKVILDGRLQDFV